jgi:predicted helicase
LHIEYEQQPEYALRAAGDREAGLAGGEDGVVEGQNAVRYNEFLTLSGIPPQVYECRLGNRSALEWVVDLYRVSTDGWFGIVNDPNREDDPDASFG